MLQITPKDLAKQLRDAPAAWVLVDVREAIELADGFIPESLHIPKASLLREASRHLPEKSKTIVLYCQSGVRSEQAARALIEQGYDNVGSMVGGFRSWDALGYAKDFPQISSLDSVAQKRYARHLRLPEVGLGGQQKLLQSSVLVVGAGGLGSPVLLYLAAAGVGRLGVVDADVVDESNLQRQVIHNEASIGVAKVQSALTTLEKLNSTIKIDAIAERLSADNVDRILSDYDLIVDASDNFKTRYLLNDACIHHQKALVSGAIFRFEGQVAVFDVKRGGPCYRCLFPQAPAVGSIPDCNDAGVLGVLPGTLGMLMATEVLKELIGLGESLRGYLLVYEALHSDMRKLKINKNAQCICSKKIPT